MNKLLALALLAGFAASCAAQSPEPVLGACEGCEAVFEGLPEHLPSRARIGPKDEPGEPLSVSGRVLGADGKPRAGVIVYAYQTDARGVYPRPAEAAGSASRRHGQLRAWARSGPNGSYGFETVRPASYPDSNIPQHIHMHVIEPACATYYIDDILFTDDPMLTAQERQRQRQRAGSGISTPTKKDGRWQVTRDIKLGLNIPDYPGCGAGGA